MNSHGSYSHQEQEKDIRSGIEIQNVGHTTNHIIGDINRLVVLDDCTCIIVNHLEQSRNVHIEEGVLVIKLEERDVHLYQVIEKTARRGGWGRFLHWELF